MGHRKTEVVSTGKVVDYCGRFGLDMESRYEISRIRKTE